MDETKVVWKRPARGEHGERITGLGLTEGGRLFLTAKAMLWWRAKKKRLNLTLVQRCVAGSL